MESNMFEKIIEYKNGDEKSLLEIIKIFNPLIIKYSRLLDEEDTKQDLILHLIKVMNNIPTNKKLKNKEIVGYVAKAIRNEYINLSKKMDKIKINEVELNLDMEIGYEECEYEFEILDMFKVLSKKECFIMRLLYIHYLSISEVADYMKISRQAVNQAKNRALKKIKKMYLE
ncbi:MAG: sigma-70 family RNA polymerase sigma factor [Clostridium sp.]|nr:sigma-70 family RNA polymerase sigma factor [Clostridium sp.]